MKRWNEYTPGQLAAGLEQGTIDTMGPGGRSCGNKDSLWFPASSTRGNGGFPNSGMNIPESIQFFVGPPACGRHADFDLMSTNRGHRFYRIRIAEQDLVNGTIVDKVNDQIFAFLEAMETKPRVVEVCVTCVDALLNSDFDGMAARLKQRYGIRFALIRMCPILTDSVRSNSQMLIESQYSLLQPSGVKQKTINILGRIQKIPHESELYQTLKAAGYRVNNILECETLEQYDALGDACLNLVAVRNAIPAAKTMRKRFGIPYLPFFETCSPDEILENYRQLEKTLGCSLPVEQEWLSVRQRAQEVAEKHGDRCIIIGHAYDYVPLKLAVDLRNIGLPVKKAFINDVKKTDLPYLKALDAQAPDLRIFFASDPEMVYHAYQPGSGDLTIGLEPTHFIRCPGMHRLSPGEQPMEFMGLMDLLNKIDQTLSEEPKAAPAPAAPDPYARRWGPYRKEL